MKILIQCGKACVGDQLTWLSLVYQSEERLMMGPGQQRRYGGPQCGFLGQDVPWLGVIGGINDPEKPGG